MNAHDDDRDDHDQTTVESNPHALTTPDAGGVAAGAMLGPLVAGEVIGDFKIHKQIGKGGMGVVFSAQERGLNRRVALKLILGADSDKMRVRMRREAQTLAALNHPNIPKVWRCDYDSQGRLYIAMEFLDGCSMRKWFEREPDIDEVLRVFLGCGRALAAAHDAGVFHRDFKPDNVLIDNEGTPFVIDFGLTRRSDETVENIHESMERSNSVNGNLTQTGTRLGTPPYMAPELLERRAEARGDSKSDQFAFCVSLFEALYGRRPFVGRSRAALEAAIVTVEVEPPKDGRLSGKVPRKIWRLIRRGLAKNPAARFPSMHELNAVLERVVEPKPRWKLYAASLLVVLGAAIPTTAYLVRQQRWENFEKDCLSAARAAYIRGDPEAAKLTIDKPSCADAAPRSFHVEGSARALRSMAILFNESKIDEVHVHDANDGARRWTADDELAAVLDELLSIDALAPAERLDELARRRSALFKGLDRAGSRDQYKAAAPHMNLVLRVLLREQLAGDAELEARLDEALAEIRGSTDEPAFFLVFARQYIEPDIAAAQLLQHYADKAAQVAELRELLWSVRAFRLALAATHTPEDTKLREQARAALAHPDSTRPLDPRSRLVSARVELARLVVALLDNDPPTAAELESVAQWADMLWWDRRYVEAADWLIATAEDHAQREQLERDIKAHEQQILAETATVEQLRAEAEELRHRAAQLDADEAFATILEWSNSITAAREVLGSESAVDPVQLESLITELERFVDRPDLPNAGKLSSETIVELEARLSTAPGEASSEPRRTVVPTHDVWFSRKLRLGADFEVKGQGKGKGIFQIMRPELKAIRGSKIEVRCRATDTDEWSDWQGFESDGSLKLVCTESGVERK